MVQLPICVDPGATSLLRFGLVIDNGGLVDLFPEARGGDASGHSSSKASDARARFRVGRGGREESERSG